MNTLNILIIAYNNKDLIDKCVQSINEITSNTRIHIIDSSDKLDQKLDINNYPQNVIIYNTDLDYKDEKFPINALFAYNVQWFIDNKNIPFILLDSNIIVNRDLNEFVTNDDKNLIIKISIDGYHTKPTMYYINATKLRDYKIQYFDKNNIQYLNYDNLCINDYLFLKDIIDKIPSEKYKFVRFENNLNVCKTNNVGIAAMIKDTPDWMMKEWIEHHFNIGVKEIYLIIDVGSKPIYQDKRVNYIYLTDESRNNYEWIGNKYSNNGSYGSNIQLGVMNMVLEKVRNQLDWLACIDDDEFLYVDLNELKNYENESCVLVPWKMMFTPNLKNNYSFDNYFEFPSFPRHVGSGIYTKCFINTKNMQHIKCLHHGDYSGVIMDFPEMTEDYYKSRGREFMGYPKTIITLFNKTKNYIKHYKYRSFEEWVERVFDRKYLIYNSYGGRNWNQDLLQYFWANPFYTLYDYSENTLNYYLDKINRQDVKNNPYYIYAKFPQYDDITGDITIIYNKAELGMIPYQKIENMVNQYEKYILIDYDFRKINYESIIKFFDKNEFVQWLKLYNERNGEWLLEDECVKKVLGIMYPNANLKILYVQ